MKKDDPTKGAYPVTKRFQVGGRATQRAWPLTGVVDRAAGTLPAALPPSLCRSLVRVHRSIHLGKDKKEDGAAASGLAWRQ